MIDALPDIRGLTTHPLWLAAADGLVIVNDDGVIQAANGALLELFGYSADDLVGQRIEVLVPYAERDAHVHYRRNYARDPVTRPMGASALIEGQRSDGSTFPTMISISRIETSEGVCSIAAVRDLTSRAAAEEGAAVLHRQRLMAEDHDLIARELHDNVIQRLFALGFSLQVILDHPFGVDVNARIRQAVRGIDGLVDDIRQTIHDLKRPAPSGTRPRHQILDLVAQMESKLGFSLTVGFSGRVESTLDTVHLAELLPVLYEALMSVARNQDATEAVVHVSVDDDWVRLSVRDNSHGPDPMTPRSGLSNLALRAERLNGSLTTTIDAEGTTMVWRLPLRGKGQLAIEI